MPLPVNTQVRQLQQKPLQQKTHRRKRTGKPGHRTRHNQHTRTPETKAKGEHAVTTINADKKVPQDSRGLDESCEHEFETLDSFSGHRIKGGYKVPVSVRIKGCTKCGGVVGE